MATKKTATKTPAKTTTKAAVKATAEKAAPLKKEGLIHHSASKAAKAHALVREKFLKMDPLELAKELRNRFKVTPNTARNWARDFQSNAPATAAAK